MGYGSHGFGKVVVELFEEIKGTGSFPYETHSSRFWRLANCDHGGNVLY
jgi:hypothetical protein